jgi:hypothetical protein
MPLKSVPQIIKCSNRHKFPLTNKIRMVKKGKDIWKEATTNFYVQVRRFSLELA